MMYRGGNPLVRVNKCVVMQRFSVLLFKILGSRDGIDRTLSVRVFFVSWSGGCRGAKSCTCRE